MKDYQDAHADEGKAGDAPRMPKEQWAEMKRQERTMLYELADKTADKVLSSPAALTAYLSLQAKLGGSSLNNTLLVMAQKPDATVVCDAETWQERGRSIRKGEGGEKAIKQFKPGDEYTRADGSVAMGYKVVSCFDVSQTYGKPVPKRVAPAMPIKTKLKALMTDTPMEVMVSGEVSADVGAIYSEDDNVIRVAKGLDGNKLFFSVAREMARAAGCKDDLLCESAANIACMRFGMDIKPCSSIPGEYAAMSIERKKAALSVIWKSAGELMKRIDRNLYVERKQTEQKGR